MISPTEQITETGSIIVFPGDSILLEEDRHTLAYSTGFQKYIDSLINIPNTCYSPNTLELNKELNTIGLRTMIERAGKNYENNQNAIKRSSLNDRLTSTLHCFNYILLANEISWISFEKLNQRDIKVIDSVCNDILLNISMIGSINYLILTI